jgi:predicted RNA-binding protein with EMAP domain
MSEKYPFIPEHLTKALEDISIPLIDLIHGHLKVAMLEAEEALTEASEREEETGEAMDSMERTYAEGYFEALTELYCLTYNLSIDRQQIERDHHAKLGI